MTKKKIEKLAAKVDEIDEAVDSRITEIENRVRAVELDRPRIDLANKDNRETAESALREAQKGRKHAQVNQETLVQHATEMGQLRVRHDHAEKDLSRLEHQRDDHVQRFDEIEKDINRLQEQIHELQPKDVDPRQCPDDEPEPCVARCADGYTDLNRSGPMTVQDALDWQHRTNEAKKRLQTELDGAMAEVTELRGQLGDAQDEISAQAETIDRLDHVLEDRNREITQLKAYVSRKETEHAQLGSRSDGRLDQARETIQNLQQRLQAQPDETDLRAILELLRYFADDAMQEDGNWEGEAADQHTRAHAYLARYKDLLPESGCDDEDDEDSDERIETPLYSAIGDGTLPLRTRPGDGTIPLRAPWARGLNPNPGPAEMAAERDVFMLWKNSLEKQVQELTAILGTAHLRAQNPLAYTTVGANVPRTPKEDDDDERRPGNDPGAPEAADSNGGTAAQREVDLGPEAGQADR